jgi:nucleotide-binding universal stress UspA family protein
VRIGTFSGRILPAKSGTLKVGKHKSFEGKRVLPRKREQKMRLLIGCDGSKTMDIVRADLRAAGLPQEAEVLVLSVADVWLPEAWMPGVEVNGQPMVSAAVFEAIMHSGNMAKDAVEQASQWANTFAEELAQDFPQWKIRTESSAASPAFALVDRAKAWQADLIVVGAHANSNIERFLLGSVSSQVLAEASCSVRVSRPHRHEGGGKQRILIGVDGSENALHTIEVVASRHWEFGAEACLVVAIDSSLVTATAPLFHLFEADISNAGQSEMEARLNAMLEQEIAKLERAGLPAISILTDGNPGKMLSEEAEQWEADVIFVGATGLRGGGGALGRVARSVAERAPITVEVVR